MAKEKIKEPKIILEREYIVPLRKGWLKVPEYKRATKAIKTLKQFIARHMKLYDSDLRKIKIDQVLNNEIRFRGMKKPPARIKVIAKKFDNNIIKVELVNIPTHIKFKQAREEKKKAEVEKKVKSKKEDAEVAKPTDNETKPTEEKEQPKGDVAKEKETLKPKVPEENKLISKKPKMPSSEKNVKINRKTLSR